MAPTDLAVEIRGVTKSFGGVAAVDGVSLAIRRGEFFSLLGPSGCGKTTLLRMIGGFELPTSGEVLIGGKEMTDVPPNLRPVNMVFQHYALFPHLSVAANVAFGLRYKGISRADEPRRVAASLARVQLSGYEGRRPHQLSGGQRQRVALARALALEPEVLLLDEPLGALDQKLRKEVQVQLKKLQRELGITFVFVTHDQEEALTMSDRIAVMSRGRVEQMDEAARVFERPATEFVASFMGAENFFRGEGGGRFVVRPERLHLLAAPDAGSALRSLPVKVAERIYRGATTVWVVTSEDGTRYAVSRQEDDDEGVPPPGASAVLAWRPEHEVPISDVEAGR